MLEAHRCDKATCLPRLSVEILQDDAMADLAAIMYIWNPASVFYSAAYTESLYAFAAFGVLYHLDKRPWLAATMFSLTSATRSNGETNLPA